MAAQPEDHTHGPLGSSTIVQPEMGGWGLMLPDAGAGSAASERGSRWILGDRSYDRRGDERDRAEEWWRAVGISI